MKRRMSYIYAFSKFFGFGKCVFKNKVRLRLKAITYRGILFIKAVCYRHPLGKHGKNTYMETGHHINAHPL